MILIAGNEKASINYKDNWYHFLQNSSFRYYFGLNQAGLTGIINLDKREEVLFWPQQSIDDMIWTGALPNLSSLASQVGIQKVLPTEKLAAYLSGVKQLHYLPPYRPKHLLNLHVLTWRSI